MKLDHSGQLVRAGGRLIWAAIVLISSLGSGVGPLLAGTNEWTSVGPFGGFIKALIIDPQNTRTMYAATYDGIFKTTDGAATWMPASAGLTGSYPIFAGLAIDPRDPSNLYAWGVNVYGMFKTTDGAATWNPAGLPDRFQVSAVAIAPDSTTYVSGTFYGVNYGPPQYSSILRSIDGDASWDALTLPDHFFAQRLAIDPQSPNTIYVAGYVYAGDPKAMYSTVLRTTDGGSNWAEGARLDGTFRASILISDPAMPNSIYAGTWGGGIYKSADGGGTWNAINSGLPDGFRSTLALTIDPQNSERLYAAMGVVSSSQPLPQGERACCVFPGSVFKTANGGASWTEANGEVQRRPGRRADRAGIDRLAFDINGDGDFFPLGVGLAIDPAGSGAVYVGTNGDGVFRSTDEGRTWGPVNAGLNGLSINTVAADPLHSGTIYAASWTRLFKSNDGGLTWRAGPWGNPGLFVSSLAIDPQQPETIYGGVADGEYWVGGLFKSTNGGATWSRTGLDCGVDTLLIDPQDAVYAGACGLYRTSDGGANWTKLTAPATQSYVLDPLSPSQIYAVDTYAGDALYKSLDGGLSWTAGSLPSPGERPPLTLLPTQNPDTVYAGMFNPALNESSLYKSTDGASSWKRIGSGDPLAIDPQNPLTIYAVQPFDVSVNKNRASTLIRSTDGGKTWTDVGAGLTGALGRLAFDSLNSSSVYATTGFGVYAITFVP
jgi:photosystem II stability/assembly factor-like uncharacterized protein